MTRSVNSLSVCLWLLLTTSVDVDAWTSSSSTKGRNSFQSIQKTSSLNVATGIPMDGSFGSGGFVPVVGTGTETTNDNDSKVGVLMLNLGGPEKTEDVEGKLRCKTIRVSPRRPGIDCTCSHKRIHAIDILLVPTTISQDSCIICLPIQILFDYQVP